LLKKKGLGAEKSQVSGGANKDDLKTSKTMKSPDVEEGKTMNTAYIELRNKPPILTRSANLYKTFGEPRPDGEKSGRRAGGGYTIS